MGDFRFNGAKINRDGDKETFGFIFFLNSYLSQWYASNFEEDDETPFSSCEQYMMYRKAELFKDEKAIIDIFMNEHPSIIKKIGRNVKNFDKKIWDKHKEEIVYRGNYLKFTQNPKLKKKLLDTKEKILVECNPKDSIWGIGKSINDITLSKTEEWGENLLGKQLMKVRDTIKVDI